MSPQKQNKTILWIAAALVIAIAVFALCYLFFAPQAADGAKTITIAVTDDQNTTTVYETTTDAQYLRQAMEDTKDLTFQGTEGQYGLMLDTINGLTAIGKKTRPGGASMSMMHWPITELTVSQLLMVMSSSSSTAHKTMQNNVRQLARLPQQQHQHKAQQPVHHFTFHQTNLQSSCAVNYNTDKILL